MINFPNKWEAGVEYDFGNGLFGRRFKGKITSAAGVVSDIVLLSTHVLLVSSGGYLSYKYLGSVPIISMVGQSDNVNYSSIVSLPGYGLRLSCKNQYASSNEPYDIWVKYEKVI